MRAAKKDFVQAIFYAPNMAPFLRRNGWWDPMRDVLHVHPGHRGARVRRYLRRWRRKQELAPEPERP